MARPITLAFAMAATTLLTGCVTAASPPATPEKSDDPPIRSLPNACKDAPGQRFIGQKASAETGAALLAATGARGLRWVPPDTAVTMDYKFGRLTVYYDRDRTITHINCG